MQERQRLPMQTTSESSTKSRSITSTAPFVHRARPDQFETLSTKSNPCQQQSSATPATNHHSRHRRPDQQEAAEVQGPAPTKSKSFSRQNTATFVARTSSRRERRGSSADPFDPPVDQVESCRGRRAVPLIAAARTSRQPKGQGAAASTRMRSSNWRAQPLC